MKMNMKMETIIDAASEAETIGGIELYKAKIVLEQTLSMVDEYAKYHTEFYQTADGNYIRTMIEIAFDYVYENMKRVEEISEFLYNIGWKAKASAKEEKKTIKMQEVA